MPIFSEHMREIARERYDTLIHNSLVAVDIAIERAKIEYLPGYVNTTTDDSVRHHQFTGFRCSIYDMLSGKLSRIFRNRLAEIALEFGIWDDVAYVVQYVDGQYILQEHAGLATNAVPSATILNDALIDFTTLNIRGNLPNGVIGAQIHNVTDGSKANIVSYTNLQIVTSGLTGGTDNTFTLGDAYKIMNVNDLQVGDRVQIENNWREVLAVVKDSDGIQHSAFTADG